MTATTVTGSAAPRGGPLDHVALHHVINLDELYAFLRWLGERHDGMVCADTESDALNPHRDRHRMTQIGDKWHGWAFPPWWMGPAHEALARYTGPIGGWNLPYDVRVLGHQSGLWLPWHQLHDGQLIGHLADSAAPTGLKLRASRDIDPTAIIWERQFDDVKRKNGWTFATIPWDHPWYWQYGAADTVLTSWEIDKHLPVVQQRFAASYDIEMAYARICAGMMSAGLMIDRPWITEWTSKISAYYDQAMAWLNAHYGITSVNASADIGRALEAAGIPIGPRTRTGQPQVDKKAMEAYQANYPHASDLILVLRYAKKSRAIINNQLAKFDRLAVGDIMHYSINTIGAQRTSRSSVTEPAMQTFDRDNRVIRGCFIPRPGYRLLTIDANQIEMRFAAIFSGDPQLLADFARCDATGESFFVNFASGVYQREIAKSNPLYTASKNTAYSILFGSGPDTAAVTAGLPLPQIRPIYDGFKSRYRKLSVMMDDIVYQGKRSRRPVVTTLFGRELRVDRGREYSGTDYKIQGSAAEWLKHCVIRLDAAGYGPLLRLTQHDEIIMEAPEAEAQAVLADVTRIITDTTSFPLPITWDGTVLDGRWVKA